MRRYLMERSRSFDSAEVRFAQDDKPIFDTNSGDGILAIEGIGSQTGKASSAPQFNPDPNAEKTSGPEGEPVCPRCHSSAAISSDAEEVFP